jgi:hypothetical protein
MGATAMVRVAVPVASATTSAAAPRTTSSTAFITTPWLLVRLASTPHITTTTTTPLLSTARAVSLHSFNVKRCCRRIGSVRRIRILAHFARVPGVNLRAHDRDHVNHATTAHLIFVIEIALSLALYGGERPLPRLAVGSTQRCQHSGTTTCTHGQRARLHTCTYVILFVAVCSLALDAGCHDALGDINSVVGAVDVDVDDDDSETSALRTGLMRLGVRIHNSLARQYVTRSPTARRASRSRDAATLASSTRSAPCDGIDT